MSKKSFFLLLVGLAVSINFINVEGQALSSENQNDANVTSKLTPPPRPPTKKTRPVPITEPPTTTETQPPTTTETEPPTTTETETTESTTETTESTTETTESTTETTESTTETTESTTESTVPITKPPAKKTKPPAKKTKPPAPITSPAPITKRPAPTSPPTKQDEMQEPAELASGNVYYVKTGNDTTVESGELNKAKNKFIEARAKGFGYSLLIMLLVIVFLTFLYICAFVWLSSVLKKQ